MASYLQWIPESLYNSAISVVVANYGKVRKELKQFPEDVQFDVYYKLYKQGRLCQLGEEFCDLDTFARILRVHNKRDLLHHCFQALKDHGVRVSKVLADAYKLRCCVSHSAPVAIKDKIIQLGSSLGGLLADAGWFMDCEQVIVACLQLCKTVDDSQHAAMALECCFRLIHVRNAFCKFAEAEAAFVEAYALVETLKQSGFTPNLAGVYSEFCGLFFVKSHYDESFRWCIEALKEITPQLPARVIIDVLRQASKACVVKREFDRAEILIKQAVYLARESFGCKHPKYSDALLDYGFYLLNVDSISQSVKIYQSALDVRLSAFGGNNLHVAVAHEDLAYAMYVHEYSSGRFTVAKEHAERAMDIMSHLLPSEHLLLASSKRVKALILEEIAIDNHDKEVEQQLLGESQELHLSALNLAIKAFGEMNVQTAKHYGNLGRLYQSMRRFQEAEEMHKKAILIKEELLGPNDYEVALSVGHLASLYNYDMSKYTEAEQLYLRSIAIGKKLFGDGYSGLEYDYRGLLKVYNMLGEHRKAAVFTNTLHQWKILRDQQSQNQDSPLNPNTRPRPIQEVIQEFFAAGPLDDSSPCPTLNSPSSSASSSANSVPIDRPLSEDIDLE